MSITTLVEPGGPEQADDAEAEAANAEVQAEATAGVSLFPEDGADRSIPLRTGDLSRLLLTDSSLSREDHKSLRHFIKLLGATFHYEYYSWLVELKELYARIDPDSDCAILDEPDEDTPDDADEAFLGPFEAALIRANYRRLEFKVLEQAIAAPNEVGLNYQPDLSIFEHLRVYVRGQGRVVRSFRSARKFFRRIELSHDTYRRVVVVLKFQPKVKFRGEEGEHARTDVVYLRLFRDVPYVEMDMHLPEQGTRVRMRWIDKLQIASPLAIGLPTLAWHLVSLSTISPWAIGTLLAGPVGAGLKSFFGFHRTKQRHLHRMIRRLYYLTLANNSSVITRLVDSAEEEDFKEALLAYAFLWLGRDDPAPWDEERLDRAIEVYLREKTGISIDFEIGDALAKLIRLGLLERTEGDRLVAVPIDRALAILDEQWDNQFKFD